MRIAACSMRFWQRLAEIRQSRSGSRRRPPFTAMAYAASLRLRGPMCPRPSSTPMEMRSEEHTSELQSLMRISYAVFCLKKKKITHNQVHPTHHTHDIYRNY